MSRVWEDDARYDKWLQIEVAVCEAWTEEGVIPESEMELIRGASYDLEIFDEAMKETKHDMTAFLRAMYPSVGSGARYLHLGLTTSDVWDTALSMQMVEAVGLLLGEVDRLIRALESKSPGAQGHGDDRADARSARRADNLRAEAGALGRRDAAEQGEAGEVEGVGGGGEDLGGGGDVCPGVAGDRGAGCAGGWD